MYRQHAKSRKAGGRALRYGLADYRRSRFARVGELRRRSRRTRSSVLRLVRGCRVDLHSDIMEKPQGRRAGLALRVGGIPPQWRISIVRGKAGVTICCMSRLRRLLVADKIFFITCNVSRIRLPLVDADFVCLAEAILGVRARRKFLFTGYVFMPDHWHALVAPDHGDAIPKVMDANKVAGMRRVNARQGVRGSLWQPRYYDEIIWTVKQYNAAMDYMHFNPVKRGLVASADGWAWSSFHSYGGSGEIRLEVDRISLPANQNARFL